MDWERYKQICDTPNVFSRWMLEQTGELTSDRLGAALEQALQLPPVPKPEGHRGGAATDMFELALSVWLVDDIANEVREAAAVLRTTSATEDRGLGGFAEAWNEYAEFLSEKSTRGKAFQLAPDSFPSGTAR